MTLRGIERERVGKREFAVEESSEESSTSLENRAFSKSDARSERESATSP
jgi:hypothetical protein